LTAGMWSWKLKSSKECVTTHLPKKAVPKMDAAEMIYQYRSFLFHTETKGEKKE
jgi:hypothetical protein